jgi:hypothetical protein
MTPPRGDAGAPAGARAFRLRGGARGEWSQLEASMPGLATTHHGRDMRCITI